MRKIYYLIPLIAIAAFTFLLWPESDTLPKKPRKYSKEQRIDGAMEDRLFTSSDVDLGYIPYKKLFKAINEGVRRVALQSQNRSGMMGTLTDAVWRERGPNNIGGRTRAIMIDESDPSRNRIWAGGVSGGVWRTEDITQSDPQWVKLGIYFTSTSIGDIAQDPNNHNVVYVGTGESYTNDFPAVGMFKTTDDGATWAPLPSTSGSNFQAINELHVDKNSYVYAATSNAGVLKSTDGGETWEKVLGTALSGATNNRFHDIMFIEANQTFYASSNNSVFKSLTGNRGEWENIGTSKPGFPTNLNRTELAVCASDPDMMYVLGAVNNEASNTYTSNDGGESWAELSRPGMPGQDFTNGQAWYDLEIAADPGNCRRILAGGVPMMESTTQGFNWQGIGGGQIHVDHHFIHFDEKKPGRVLYGNDGGVWLSENGGQTIISKNRGYVTTQFYAAAIHPDEGSPYILGGTQDNNSLQITEAGLSPANSVWGGDGVFCFIDQNEPHIQIVSSQFGNYGLSTDGGLSFGGGADAMGDFINRSGYDDEANILYGQTNPNLGTFFRWKINEGPTDYVRIQGIPLHITAVKVDPHVPNRVYFGGDGGRVVRVDNANEELSVPGTLLVDLPGNASVSSVYLDKQTPDDILVSLFNYGTTLENIWISTDGGIEFTSIEGDLPDIPVRWAIFDPANHDRVMIATDAGIWTTEDVNGDQTHWEPINPDNGMPFVRVDMLVMRDSDKVVLAATHGRGMMTTDVFSAPAAVIVAQPIAYEGQTITIDGSQSVNAESYEWDLGDNTTSTQKIVTHAYSAPGTYQITLTINGSITLVRSIAVLPYLPTPFEIGLAGYTGDFESHPEHFASYTVQGTGFQRGNSSKAGKDGTHSGSSAWVLGPNDNLYLNNTRAEFYTPQYDLTTPGLYELKFWTKYAVQNRNDGFQIEYSIDGGASWKQLGTRDDPAWYNYYNAQLADGAFPIGKAYFTNAQLNWTQYVKDISFLGGEPRVSFRYVFRSDGSEPAQGLALDDFEITKFDGELKTTITNFTAEYTSEDKVTINWTTGIEYHANKFNLERSSNGFDYESVVELNAKGRTTTVPQSYEWVNPNSRDVTYYRIEVINDDTTQNFYSDVIVVRRDVNPDIVHKVIKNPFYDQIVINFTSIMNQEVTVRLFDTSGRMVREQKSTPNSVVINLNHLDFPIGIYILSVQIADNEPKTYKLLKWEE